LADKFRAVKLIIPRWN